jgi:hypothetical protein
VWKIIKKESWYTSGMTKSKRMFAEMLVDAQGFGDPDEIAKNKSLVDIIYAIKKVEEEVKKEEEPEVKKEEEPLLITKIRDIWSRLNFEDED